MYPGRAWQIPRAITTEILPAPEFYFAEDYHQQYLARTPPAIAASAAPA